MSASSCVRSRFPAAPFLSILLLAPCTGRAEEKPAPPAAEEAAPPRVEPPRPAPGFELKEYDVTLLNDPIPSFPFPDIELRSRLSGRQDAADAAFKDPQPTRFMSGESIVQFITSTVAQESWSEPRPFIAVYGNRLVVIQTPAAHAKVAEALAYLEGEAARQIAVEGTVALVDDALLEEWRAGAPDPVTLTDVAAKGLHEALAKGERAVRLKILCAVARSGQFVVARALSEHAYVQDYKVQVTTVTAAYDPTIGHLLRGAVLGMRPFVLRDRIVCEIRFARQDGTLPVPQFDMALPGAGRLGLPETDAGAVETTVMVRDGRTLLAGRVSVAHPKAAPRRSLCFFIRAARVPPPASPPPPPAGGRTLRFFDAGSLTMSMPEFPTRHLGNIPTPGLIDKDTPALKPVFEPQTLLDAIRINVAPETWEDARHTMEFRDDKIFACQSPAVLDRIGAHLDDLAARHVRLIHTRVDLVAAEAAAYDRLRETCPSLGAGTLRLSPADAAAILARAARGDGLTLAASGEVAGINRQRVNVRRAFAQSTVYSYECEAESLIHGHAPHIADVTDGFTLDCQPAYGLDGKTVHARLRIYWAWLERPVPSARSMEQGAMVHRPAMSLAPIPAAVAAEAGEPLLLGGIGPVKTPDGDRYFLAIVRFTPAE